MQLIKYVDEYSYSERRLPPPIFLPSNRSIQVIHCSALEIAHLTL
jgi:hypothetical protein